ncbi:MAG: serine protease [Candidatus Competibacteraceae bacterium]
MSRSFTSRVGRIPTRRQSGIILLILCLLAVSPVRAALPDIIDKIRPAIVAVGTVQPTRRPPAQFRASGFAVADGRYILTNAHVVPEMLDTQQKEYLAVFTGRGQRFEGRTATTVAMDREHDLALLKVEGSPLPALAIDWSKQVREGQDIIFTGFPIGIVLGLYPVTHHGMISALTPIAIPPPAAGQLNPNLIKRLQNPFEVFQLDATAYPGNSGSPLCDATTGRVIGVINSVFIKESKETILQQPSGITYAIPISYAKDLFTKAGLTIR